MGRILVGIGDMRIDGSDVGLCGNCEIRLYNRGCWEEDVVLTDGVVLYPSLKNSGIDR